MHVSPKLAAARAGIALTLLIALAKPAQAQYVDPGSAGIIIQAVVAALVGAAAVLRLYWGKITAFLARRSRQDPEPR